MVEERPFSDKKLNGLTVEQFSEILPLSTALCHQFLGTEALLSGESVRSEQCVLTKKISVGIFRNSNRPARQDIRVQSSKEICIQESSHGPGRGTPALGRKLQALRLDHARREGRDQRDVVVDELLIPVGEVDEPFLQMLVVPNVRRNRRILNEVREVTKRQETVDKPGVAVFRSLLSQSVNERPTGIRPRPVSTADTELSERQNKSHQ